MRSKVLRLVLAGIAAFAGLVVPAAAQVRVEVDPSHRFQTFRDWEATANLQFAPEIAPVVDRVFDLMLDEAGITRLRVGVFSGDEKPRNAMRDFLDRTIGMPDWKRLRYNTINDNADPFDLNMAGFDFADLDWKVENVFLPMRAKAEARGQKLAFNLNYVGFTADLAGGDYHHTNPEEYAEFVLAAFLHLDTVYGIVPEYFEPLLEPDMVKEWSPALLGQAVAAAVRRLEAAGYQPKLLGPSVTNAANAVEWFDALVADPLVAGRMAELSYHRYRGGKPLVLQAIADRAAVAGIPSAMLEFFNGKGTYPVLHSDLAIANAASWQGRAVTGYYKAEGDALTPFEDVRYNLEYMKVIRPGSVRVAATSNDATVSPLAFVGADGRMAVVMMVEAAGEVALSGLPSGAYR
ncbi:MAG: hypothetical protein RLZZ528_740, partial [Pseudomonadota bacterium]